jgi:DNA-binding PadR family transcriptional regulator
MVSVRAAVLLALRGGPSYGRELVRRVKLATRGQLRLSEGTLYPALRALRASRLLRAWTVIPGRRQGGRARTYYELTIQGVRQSEELAATLTELASGFRPRATTTPAERDAMQNRLRRVAEISEAMMTLRDAGARARRRG